MVDHVVIGVSHPSLLRNALAVEQTIAFLREGGLKAMTVSRKHRGL